MGEPTPGSWPRPVLRDNLCVHLFSLKMRRGASPSARSPRSGRGNARNAQASPVPSDSSSIVLSSPRASSSRSNNNNNAAASPSLAAPTAASSRVEGTNYLVALAGMKALESHVQDLSKGKKWKDRVMSWEERAGLGLPSVKLALGFLDVLGVSLVWEGWNCGALLSCTRELRCSIAA